VYAFVLTTLAGTQVSELPLATSKRVTVAGKGQGVSSFVVRAGADADFLLEGDALVRIYDVDDLTGTRTLIGHHRLISAEEVADGSGTSVAAAFADPLWVLIRRLVGKTAGGYSRGTSLAPVDRGTILSELLAATNADSPSGVTLGSLTASSSTYVAGWYFKPFAEALAELGATLDGPEWRIRPIEFVPPGPGTDEKMGYYGALDLGPALSQIRPDAVFEYGDGPLNVRAYRRAVSLEGSANRLFSLPAGFPDAAVGSILQVEDTPSRNARGLLEAVVPADVVADELRLALLDSHIGIRKGARRTITFEPVRDLTGRRVPKLGRDFNVGDIVPFRASAVNTSGVLVKRINALVRIYSYTVEVDQAGAGTPTLTVTPT
jgi:hypothetical protein